MSRRRQEQLAAKQKRKAEQGKKPKFKKDEDKKKKTPQPTFTASAPPATSSSIAASAPPAKTKEPGKPLAKTPPPQDEQTLPRHQQARHIQNVLYHETFRQDNNWTTAQNAAAAFNHAYGDLGFAASVISISLPHGERPAIVFAEYNNGGELTVIPDTHIPQTALRPKTTLSYILFEVN